MRIARTPRIARLLLLVALLATALVPARAGGDALYAVDVATAGRDLVASLTSDRGVRWWVELGDVLVVSGSEASRVRAAEVARVRELEGPTGDEQLFVTRLVHPNHISTSTHAESRLVVASGIYALVAATPEGVRDVASHGHGEIAPVRPGTVYARSAANDANVARAATRPSLRSAAASVDVGRWRSTVADLVAFETRYVGTDGALEARDYLVDAFSRAGLDVSVEQFTAAGEPSYNVVAELRGAFRPEEVYIVCGHYDSISERRFTLAPGAEDNGSGAAGVVELARVFAANPPAATIRFIAFSGEEVGLVGSRRYVDEIVQAGTTSSIKGVINMDMIAYTSDADLDVLLETSEVGVPLADALEEAAAATRLRVVRSLNPFGSDHVPFLQRGIPCVLTIENDWDEYDDYHTSNDSMANVSSDMGGEVLKMNAGALAALAGDASSGADVALAAPHGRTVLYGGFVQTIEWTAGGDLDSFDIDLSLDGGATFAPIAVAVSPIVRAFHWTVPAELATTNGRLRITARTATGATVTDVSDAPLDLRPSDGPVIRKVKLKRDKLVVTGRLPLESARIYVDDVPLETTNAAGGVDGNTAKKLVGTDSRLGSLVPRGVPVRVRVVDDRTGLTTTEVTYTR